MPDDSGAPEYSAKSAYQSHDAAAGYEKRPVYRTINGRYRWWIENRSINRLLDDIPEGSVFLDCPCGNGRWLETLARRASRIVAVDVSKGMVEFTTQRAAGMDLDIEVLRGDAERLPLEDGAVDYTYSFALTKHLPVPVQYQVLAEFARVSRRGVLCSFSILKHLSYEFWRGRKLEESYPVFIEEVGWMADAAGLVIRRTARCSTPIGLEHVVLFDKAP